MKIRIQNLVSFGNRVVVVDRIVRQIQADGIQIQLILQKKI